MQNNASSVPIIVDFSWSFHLWRKICFQHSNLFYFLFIKDC